VWRQAGGHTTDYSAELAAMLIYLNRTGYNGLFRVNATGEYNVPPGRYDRPRVLDQELLALTSRAITAPNVRICRTAFEHILTEPGAGDFVYFDPPYAPVSATANFRGYTGRGFDDEDQQRLQSILIALARRGVQVLLSNSTAAVVSLLYEKNPDASRAGLRTWRVPARRAVNPRADGRGPVQELLVSNIRPGRPGSR
jgi:DNA adenine methylase